MISLNNILALSIALIFTLTSGCSSIKSVSRSKIQSETETTKAKDPSNLTSNNNQNDPTQIPQSYLFTKLEPKQFSRLEKCQIVLKEEGPFGSTIELPPFLKSEELMVLQLPQGSFKFSSLKCSHKNYSISYPLQTPIHIPSGQNSGPTYLGQWNFMMGPKDNLHLTIHAGSKSKLLSLIKKVGELRSAFTPDHTPIHYDMVRLSEDQEIHYRPTKSDDEDNSYNSSPSLTQKEQTQKERVQIEKLIKVLNFDKCQQNEMSKNPFRLGHFIILSSIKKGQLADLSINDPSEHLYSKEYVDCVLGIVQTTNFATLQNVLITIVR